MLYRHELELSPSSYQLRLRPLSHRLCSISCFPGLEADQIEWQIGMRAMHTGVPRRYCSLGQHMRPRLIPYKRLVERPELWLSDAARCAWWATWVAQFLAQSVRRQQQQIDATAWAIKTKKTARTRLIWLLQ